MSNEIQKSDRGRTTYEVAGQSVTLSYQIVRDFLTKGNGDVTDQDIVQFISICKYNQFNPFLNEAYLVKYGNAPAQMIVSKEGLIKRADACEEYQGMRGGVIIQRGDEVLELEGSFYLKSDILVGGWAEVWREDRKFPFISKVNLEEYDTKKSTWNQIKSTMIVKVAKVQALREAFPAQLGAMYTAEEVIEKEDTKAKVEKKKQAEANREVIDIDAEIYEEESPKEEPKAEAPKEEPREPKGMYDQENGPKKPSWMK